MSAKLSISSKRRKRAINAKGRTPARKRVPVSILSVLVALFIWAAALLIVNSGRSLKFANLAPGQRAPATMLAEVDFKTIDSHATELDMSTAAARVPPVFSIRQNENRLGLQKIDKLFDRLAAIYKSDTGETLGAESISDLTDAIGLLDVQMTAEELIAAVPASALEEVRSALKDSVEAIWSQGIIASEDKLSQFQGRAKMRRINLMSGSADAPILKQVDVDTLNIPAESTAAIMTAMANRMASHPRVNQIVPPLVMGWIVPNLEYEADKSEELRAIARDKVPSVFRQIRTGSTLMEGGAVVDEDTLELLQVHQAKLSETEQARDIFLDIIRYSVLLLGMLIVAGAVLHLNCPDLLRDPVRIALFGLLSLIAVGAAKALLYSSAALDLMAPSLVMYWMPYALAALLATMLVGSKFAMSVILFSSFGAALVLEGNLAVFLLGLLSGFTVSLSTREIHKRSNVFRAGLLVGVVQFVFALLLGVINQTPLATLSLQAAVAFFSGPLIAFLALLIIPFLEYVFKITTDVRLLELSDMGHPLLERLALEAPGTYHHSLMVANLASSAAAEIGANDLLVRVCAYYHDVGKMVKPEFFIENIPYKDNPHDDLSPSMSTLVIISHVKEGLSMAARHNLPQPIIDGIEQHHGTSKIAYFYHRAMELEEEQATDKKGKGKGKGKGSKVREEDYRYPGPKPQSVEMGILLIADAIEAASRSMDKPSPSNIESLVTEIVQEKVKDGQLDDCGMNFTQLAAIRKSFIYNLNNMLHGRIAYPKDKEKDENRDQQPADTVSAKSTQGGEPRLVAHAASTKPGA
jgi:putative nucleotidyltransferase with HDIG domain